MAGNSYNGSWNWQGENNCLQIDSNFDIPECVWNEVSTNQEDISFMFDDSTPLKACGDLTHHVDHRDSSKGEQKEYSEPSSRAKRRRMLQFDTQASSSLLRCEEIPSTFLRSNEWEDSAKEASHDVSQWVHGSSEGISAASYDGMDQSTEGFLAECFNDMEMQYNPDDIHCDFPGAADVQIDISEFCNDQPEYEANTVQKRVTWSPNVIFKDLGRKSFIQPPTKLVSSIAYPFAFIKPSGATGDVTLKDINQRIHTPPPTKSKQSKEEEASASYPTSAFSGKPVVGKTKIRTEGGMGSITIMRTKG